MKGTVSNVKPKAASRSTGKHVPKETTKGLAQHAHRTRTQTSTSSSGTRGKRNTASPSRRAASKASTRKATVSAEPKGRQAVVINDPSLSASVDTPRTIKVWKLLALIAGSVVAAVLLIQYGVVIAS